MLLVLVGFTHLLLGCAIYRRSGSLLDPVVAFPLVWGAVFMGIFVGEHYGYFGVNAPALLLMLTGSLAFTIGGVLGGQLASNLRSSNHRVQLATFNFKAVAAISVIVHIVLLPLWWRDVNQIAGDYDDVFSLAYQLRNQTTTGGLTLGPVAGNYLAAGFIVVPILAVGVIFGRLRPWTALAVSTPWILTNIVTNGRAALIDLSIVLIYLYVSVGRKVSWRSVGLAIVLFAFVFIGGAMLVGKGDVDIDANAAEVGSAVLTNFFDYLLQGPILFSSYFDKPSQIIPTWDALMVPCAALEKLGLCRTEPLHQDFLAFGADGRTGNVYSIYLSVFPKYSYLGTVLFLFVYGLWAGFHHRRFKLTGSMTHGLLAAYLLAAVVVSVFNDQFGPQLNFFSKLIVLMFLLRQIPSPRQNGRLSSLLTNDFR